MNVQLFQTEAVVLNSIPFQDHDRILTLFAPQGIFKMFFQGKGRDLVRLNGLMTPLTVGEYVFSQGRKDLFRFREGTILHQPLRLRDHFESLQVAYKLMEAVLLTQWPGKPTPYLYLLFRKFLSALEEESAPHRFLAPFLLKILKHEGILQLEKYCASCENGGVARFGGEKYCRKHAFAESIIFDEKEEELLVQVAECKVLKKLLEMSQPAEWIQKIETLFSHFLTQSAK